MRLKSTAMALLLGLTAILAGCKIAPQSQAQLFESQIDQETKHIRQAAQDAEDNLQTAHEHVALAATQPSNPPVTNSQLHAADTAIIRAQGNLKPIAASTTTIETSANGAQQLTTTTANNLDEVNKSWLSPRQKHELWTGLTVLTVLGILGGVLAFAATTNGAGPLLAAGGTIVLSVFKTFYKVLLVPLFHLFTLGGVWVGKEFGKLVNKKYDAAQTAQDVHV